MFTPTDLQVYKDPLKEAKNRTSKATDKPLPHRAPSSAAKISKPALKCSDEEPQERKPLSVVHKAGNTINGPHKPSSPIPVGPSKQANQWRKIKEIEFKSPPADMIHTSYVNPLAKFSEYKTDSSKNPRESLPSKFPHIKSDQSKASGVCKPSRPASPVHQSASLSGAKAPSMVDLNASLCSECVRSASEGAVCFIGNDGRVSACTTRSAIRLCKNLNCAANNPDYVAAIANAPKKYLISKRHMLKAQFGVKSRNGRPKSPSTRQLYAVEHNGTSPPKAGSSSSSSSGGNLSPFHDEMGLFHGDFRNDKHDVGLKSGDATRAQDVLVDELTGLSFHDGEAAEPESPKFLLMESSKGIAETHSAGGIESSSESAESLAAKNFEEPDDEHVDGSLITREDVEELDVSSMCRKSEAEELSINCGDMVSSKEADADDSIGNGVEIVARRSQIGDDHVSITEMNGSPFPTMDCENGSEEDNQTSVKLLATDCNQNEENNQESTLSPTASIKQVADNDGVDESTPASCDCNDKDWCFDAGHLVDDEKNGDLSILGPRDVEHSGELVSVTVLDKQGDDHPPSHEVADNLSGGTLYPHGERVNDADITPWRETENEQSSDYTCSIHDIGGHDEYEDQRNNGDSEDDEKHGAMISFMEVNAHIDAPERKEDALNKKEESLKERFAQGQEGRNISSNGTRRQSRRVLRAMEEVSPEMVILRKQQMQGRKHAEKWMPNHAIEGVVQKLAPTGEAKVKILVEAFESIISKTD